MNTQLSTPILFIIFNRPMNTQKVFEQIRKAKPTQLFISADGPRPEHPTDKELCDQTRSILSKIDWKCTVKKYFHGTNLGCGLAPSRGISWFFEHVEEGIILEDDCVPTLSFFSFCSKLLEYYRHDTRIFQIGGTTYAHHLPQKTSSSYYFTRIPRIWGWATWKRAWLQYDFKMSSFPEFKKNNIIQNIFSHEILQQAWLNAFETTYNQTNSTPKTSIWDRQWAYTLLSQNGLSISPIKNLISNIGFQENATHTTKINPFITNNPTYEIDINKIKHPQWILPFMADESLMMEKVFETKIPHGINWEIKKTLKHWLQYGKK